MNTGTENRHSFFLLISLMFFFVTWPLFHSLPGGELFIDLAFVSLLIAALVEMANKRGLRGFSILLVAVIVATVLASRFHPSRGLTICSYALVSVFLGVVSVWLFDFLGTTGPITSGRLYASVSLYFILAVFWGTLYNLVNVVFPGSFLEIGPGPAHTDIHRGTLLYFGITTLTTLGYGDVLPLTPFARTLAALESATGVLYIAITVARLVAAYQRTNEKASAKLRLSLAPGRLWGETSYGFWPMAN